MIKIDRGPCPQSLIGSPTTGTYYNKDDVRVELLKMQYSKCCYCENVIPWDSRTREIEHFRPKGLLEFEHLINHWENLLLACRDCNGTKFNKFPEDGNGEPLLIDPSDANIDPEEHLDFNIDFMGGLEGQIYEKNKSPIGKKTIEIIKLRNGMYVRERRKHLVDCFKALTELKNSEEHTPRRDQAVRQFNDLLSANSPFAALARTFARKLNADRFGITIPSGYELV